MMMMMIRKMRMASGSNEPFASICQAHLAAQGQLKIGAQAAQSTLLRYERRRVQISAEGEVYSSGLCWWNLITVHLCTWMLHVSSVHEKCGLVNRCNTYIIATSCYDIGIAWLSSLASRSIRCEMIAQGIAQRCLYIMYSIRLYYIAFYSGCGGYFGKKDGPSPNSIAAGKKRTARVRHFWEGVEAFS